MRYTDVFKRYEFKYLLTGEEKELLLDAMKDHMQIDEYGRTIIRNIYDDTPDMRLIRTSLDRPVYKEKLRVRSYSKVTGSDPVFIEIKKKYDGIVYKRRIAVPEHQATDWLSGEADKPFDSQIANEIEYMRSYYRDLRPACFLSYEREAYKDLSGGDLRITTDHNILARTDRMSLKREVGGTAVIGKDLTLLEIKTADAYPMWLIRFLTDNKISKTSFSKYGEFYKTVIFPEMTGKIKATEEKGGLLYA